MINLQMINDQLQKLSSFNKYFTIWIDNYLSKCILTTVMVGVNKEKK